MANLDKKNVKKECLRHLLSKKTIIVVNLSGRGGDTAYLSMKCAETIVKAIFYFAKADVSVREGEFKICAGVFEFRRRIFLFSYAVTSSGVLSPFIRRTMLYPVAATRILISGLM